MLLSIYKNGKADALPFLWIVFKICENIEYAKTSFFFIKI